jgi:hypothetical protein
MKYRRLSKGLSEFIIERGREWWNGLKLTLYDYYYYVLIMCIHIYLDLFDCKNEFTLYVCAFAIYIYI